MSMLDDGSRDTSHEAGDENYSHDPLGQGWDDPREGEPTAMDALAKAAWQVLLIAGVASVVLGLIALFWTRGTLIVAGVLFGIYLVVSGIAMLAGGFSDRRAQSGGMRVLNVVVGLVSIMLGIFCFFSGLESVVLLSIWIGIGFLLRGIASVAASLAAPHVPGRGFAIFLGALAIIAGIVFITYPGGSIATLTVFAGWWLLIIGIVEIVRAIQLRSAVKKA
jgi:uncharacterized membrane protein HdeD (DUF308 family)